MKEDIENTIALYLDHYPDEHHRMAPFLIQYENDGEEILKRSNMSGHITTSMIVVSHDLKNILLIKHKSYGIWLQPGGHYEGDISLIDSARREILEETGIVAEVALPFPIDIDTHDIPARPEKNEGIHRHYDFVYLSIADRNLNLTIQEDEIDGFKWVPINDLIGLTNHIGQLARKAIVNINVGFHPDYIYGISQ